MHRYQPQFAPGSDFLYVGRLSREKGVSTLIRATAEARCRLLVAGAGPALEEMRSLAERLDADVVFLGFLTADMLNDVIRRARCVVLPSEWYENAPMSLLEAYALGKPVIGARIGGIPEFAQRVCMSFAGGDVHSLASALRDDRRFEHGSRANGKVR
jgi:glycosyltransferase involved in cell wall biosynthesis